VDGGIVEKEEQFLGEAVKERFPGAAVKASWMTVMVWTRRRHQRRGCGKFW
jgi:hypothetical protein